jgi:hypothetical protein
MCRYILASKSVLGMKERGGKVKAMVVNRTNKKTLQGKIHNNIRDTHDQLTK